MFSTPGCRSMRRSFPRWPTRSTNTAAGWPSCKVSPRASSSTMPIRKGKPSAPSSPSISANPLPGGRFVAENSGNDPQRQVLARERNMLQPNKVSAIYKLRDAADQKAVAEVKLRDQPSERHRDELLDAQMKLEAKTQ